MLGCLILLSFFFVHSFRKSELLFFLLNKLSMFQKTKTCSYFSMATCIFVRAVSVEGPSQAVDPALLGFSF